MAARVSVVVPTYNRASLIGATLESILSQSHAPAEVIVVDDGSTDDTEAVVRSFPPVVQYHRIANSGVCTVRNLGASLAQFPLMAFCDSDDLWTRDKLARQVALHINGSVDYSFTNFRIVSNGIWKEQTKFETAPPDFFRDFETAQEGLVLRRSFYDDLLRFQPVFPSTVMISKTLFEKIGGFKNELGRNSSEDFEFTLRCAQNSPIGAVAEPVVGIRKHDSNFSGDTFKQTCFEIDILNHALQSHTLSQHSRNLIAEQIDERSVEAGTGAFARGDFENCVRLLSSVPRIQLDRKQRMKFLIASYPQPIAKILRAGVLALSASRRATKPGRNNGQPEPTGQ